MEVCLVEVLALVEMLRFQVDMVLVKWLKVVIQL